MQLLYSSYPGETLKGTSNQIVRFVDFCLHFCFFPPPWRRPGNLFFFFTEPLGCLGKKRIHEKEKENQTLRKVQIETPTVHATGGAPKQRGSPEQKPPNKGAFKQRNPKRRSRQTEGLPNTRPLRDCVPWKRRGQQFKSKFRNGAEPRKDKKKTRPRGVGGTEKRVLRMLLVSCSSLSCVLATLFAIFLRAEADCRAQAAR